MMPILKHSDQVRVFISSTFLDMQEERNVLIKRVFPELRRRCLERGSDFVEVDLRWGVTEEEAENGEVLSICLQEIDQCRPYFIGLLGERYGWVPTVFPISALEINEWLQEYSDRSLTELEIVHGVLNDPVRAQNAFFYLRDPQYAAKKDTEFSGENTDSIGKLADLKRRILRSGCHVCENYPDPETLGEEVLQDLWAAIDKDHPVDQQLSPNERETAVQESFGELRQRVFVGRNSVLEQIDVHVSRERREPLIVYGESGCGKSAVLANWLARYRKTNPETHTFVHYMGSTPDSADPWQMMRRMLSTFKEWKVWDGDAPSGRDDLEDELPAALAAAGKAGIVVVLDAINQVVEDGHDLNWLPWNIPDGIQLILSVIPGDYLTTLQGRKWAELEIPLLNDGHKREIATDYLARYRKKLSEELLDEIVASAATGNPLYLKLLLDELRVFGEHEQLTSRLAWYLEAVDSKELYTKMLTRLEDDFEERRKGLVGNALGLIWASRDGLSESELLHVLGDGEQPLPRNLWSPLYLALSESLALRGGKLTFFHDCLRQAIESYYLDAAEEKRQMHSRLSVFFNGSDSLSERVVKELPWQLSKSEKWDELKKCLTDIPMFEGISSAGLYEILRYWVAIWDNSAEGRFDPSELYRNSLKQWKSSTPAEISDQREWKSLYCRILKKISSFLRETNVDIDCGIYFAEEWFDFANKNFDEDGLEVANAAFKLGVIYQYLDQEEVGLPFIQKATAIRVKHYGPDHVDVASCYYKLGEIYSWHYGDSGKATEYFEKALVINKKHLGLDHYYVANCLWNLANEANFDGDYERAYKLRQEDFAIRKKTQNPNHRNWPMATADLAEAEIKAGDYQKALNLSKRALSLAEQFYGVSSLTIPMYSLRDLAEVHLLMENFNEAQNCIQEYWDAWGKDFCLNEKPRCSLVYSRMARCNLEWGDLLVALEFIEKAFSCRDEYKDKPSFDFGEFYVTLGRIHLRLENLDKAHENLHEALTIREKKYGTEHPETAEAHYHLATFYANTGDVTNALEHIQNALSTRLEKLGKDHPLTKKTIELSDQINEERK